MTLPPPHDPQAKRKPRLTLLLKLWYLATALGAPLLARTLDKRQATGKEDPKRLPERLGRPSLPRPEGPLVWFHAASVGESLSLLPLIDRLGEARPDLQLLVTTGTVTAAAMMARRLPATARHQYVPIDTPDAVSGFLDHWRPDAAVWVESELWPRLVTMTEARGIPMLLANARISEGSARNWARVPATAARVLGAFRHILAQDEETAGRLARLGFGADRVTVTGSTKESAPRQPVDEGKRAALQDDLGGRPLWLAASIHLGEEMAMAEAHQHALAARPDTLLLLALRHPDKALAMAEVMERQGLRTALRSRGEAPGPDCQVYIADTLGEMGLWYALSPICFVGGSFVPVGGHNPFEPLLFGAHVLHGPLYANFAPYYARFDASGATEEVADGPALGARLAELLTSDDPRPPAMAPPQGPVNAVMSQLLPLLPSP